jgi:hypothetical protein
VREAFIVFMGDQIETSKRPLTSRLPIRNMIVLLLDHSI